MTMENNNYSKVNHYIEKGVYWRAKETLQGRLSSSDYDSELFEKYGQVLVLMGDLLEAGKYLFLSGVRKNEYEECINLYLNRFTKKDIHHLFHSFPKPVKSAKYEKYPKIVINELNARGFEPNGLKKRVDIATNTHSSFSDSLIGWFFFIVFILLCVGFLIQGYRGLEWLFNWAVNS